MKRKVLFDNVNRCFIILFLLCIGSVFVQGQNLRDPKDVTIEDITLYDFFKMHKQALLEAIPSPAEEIDSVSVSVQIDYFLKQKGYGSDFLKEVDLSNVDLSKRDLRFLSLKEANLSGCTLEKADLSYVNLKEANLTGALLVKANLSRANLKEALVKNVNFSGANLYMADIHDAEGLTAAQLLSTKSLYKTWLPSALAEDVEKANPKLFKVP
jgi:uncharacterized protein YjbI with pentapeptide repeats